MGTAAKNRNSRVRRFHPLRIAEHAILMMTAGVLIVTGLSQKFHELDASVWIIMKAGGIDMIRLIHRFTGLMFSAEIIVHIAVAFCGLVFGRWQPTMMISRKDFSDAVRNIRYYIGMEQRYALCDRYSYKQKFEYWGILSGGVIMILSGLVLWFPAFVARYLPGEIIPAAKALHTNESMLLFLIIAIWHIYDSIFSPEVFPLDASIFTGYLSRERMIREHPIELARREGVSVDELISTESETISRIHEGDGTMLAP